jgi:hypothetical protein
MAGSASNWFKPDRGPLKGRAFYMSQDQQRRYLYGADHAKLVVDAMKRDPAATRDELTKVRGKIMLDLGNVFSSADGIMGLQGRDGTRLGKVLDAQRPAGAAKSAAEIAAIQAAATGAGRLAQLKASEPPIVKAKGIVPDADFAVIYKQHRSTGTTADGDPILYELYRQQGYNAKPHVLSKADMDLYVKDGEIELFRGVRDSYSVSAVDMQENYRNGPHYAGSGVYGQGSYFAGPSSETSTSAWPTDRASAIRTASSYAGAQVNSDGSVSKARRGSMIRATIRKDAKIAKYQELRDELHALHTGLLKQATALERAATRPVTTRYQALVQQLKTEQDKHLTPTGKVPKAAKAKGLYDALEARIAKLRKRSSREYDKAYAASGAKALEAREEALPNDVGHYAVMKGYDVIHQQSQDYYVVLNRGAVRVQATDPADDGTSI